MTRSELNRSGIYLIHNKINGKNYVGQAENIAVRWNEHKRDFRSNDHSNDHLQRAYQKYGADAFEWSVLEFCGLDMLDEREIYWIAEKEAYTKGYNMTIGGGGIRGFYDVHGKPVVCIESGIEYASVATATRETGANRKSIFMCCKFDAKTANGFHWRFSDMPQEEWEKLFDSRFNSPDRKCLPVVCLETGKVYRSVNEAARDARISKTAISNVCRGFHYTAGGLHWKYQAMNDDDYREMIAVIDKRGADWAVRRVERLKSKEFRESARARMKDRMNNNPEARAKSVNALMRGVASKRRKVVQVETGTIFPSATYAAHAIGVKSCCHIISCCTGKRQIAYGYHWKYANEGQAG